jgi:hypothetical protein
MHACLYTCTIPKSEKISKSIEEQVFWNENFPVILGNKALFPWNTGKLFSWGLAPLYSGIYLCFGAVFMHAKVCTYFCA